MSDDPLAPIGAALDRRDRVSTTDLLADVEMLIGRFVRLPSDHARAAVALFVLHTWAFEAAHQTPYLIVLSAEKRSGKSRLLEVLELVCRTAQMTSNVTEAALFQFIEARMPTLLIDEIDAIFGGYSERTEGIRGVINAGNRRGAVALRGTGGAGGEPRTYRVYCPKVLAGIDAGKLPETVRDRGIAIAMQRKMPGEQVERFHLRRVEPDAEKLRTDLAAWADARTPELAAAEPDLPAALDDRLADAWESLLAIADLAGDDWRQRARTAAVALAEGRDDDDASVGTQVLAAIREAFGEQSKMQSAAICDALNARDDLPFGAWRDGRGIDPRSLGGRLKPYKIRSKSLRIGDDANHRGFERAQFEDAWARYLPPPKPRKGSDPQGTPDSSATPTTFTGQSQKPTVSIRHTENGCGGSEMAANPHGTRDVADLADRTRHPWPASLATTVASPSRNGRDPQAAEPDDGED